MSAQQWTRIEEASIPKVTMAKMNDYFVNRLASDGKPTNDFKNFHTSAYPLFMAGHIQSIQVAYINTSYNITCSCLPEMKKDTLYKISLIINENGDITQATCGCPAGLGPCGTCKHIGALCYALDEYTKIKQTRSPDSCTSHLQKWNQPRKRRLDAQSVSNIKFVKHEYGKKKRDTTSMVYDPRPVDLVAMSDIESDIATLRKKLSEAKEEVALLHVLPFSLPTSTSSQSPLPLSPSLARERVLNELAAQPQPINYKCIGAAGMKLLDALTYSKDQIAQIEMETRAQRLCRRWQEEREFRITASKFGLVIKRRRNHNTLAKQLLYSKVSSGVLAILWGQQHEADALESYKNSLDPGLILSEAGIFIAECGFIGALPDGVVKDKSGQSVRLVEVKCPYKARNKSIEEMYGDPSFCCSLTNEGPTLKKGHEYYFQVQGQMAITGIHTCDFVVWTPLNFITITLTFNEGFWKKSCYPLLEKFYFNIMLPEIVYPKHPEVPCDYTDIQLYT